MHRLPTTFVLPALALVSCATGAATAGTINLSYDGPTLDRWMYPFNPDPGARISASTFGAFGEPMFDNRDGQFYVTFETSADVTPGLPSGAYQVTSARVRVQMARDLVVLYDDTPDPYTAFLDPSDPEYVADPDPGQAIELFGAGYRNGFTATTFPESGPHAPGDPLQKGVRNVFALGFDALGAPVDVSNSVDERWTPVPFAVGQIAGLAAGAFIPLDSEIELDIDVSNPDVQSYLRDALAAGVLPFCITSHTTVFQMGGDFPLYYTKEHPDVLFEFVSAARLDLSVEIGPACPADLDGSGDVGFGDILAIIGAWGPCGPSCPEDLGGNGDVDFADILAVIAAWGPC